MSVFRTSMLLLLFLLSCSTAWSQGPWKLEPGSGLGPLRLGMTHAEVRAFLPVIATVGAPENPVFLRHGSGQTENAPEFTGISQYQDVELDRHRYIYELVCTGEILNISV